MGRVQTAVDAQQVAWQHLIVADAQALFQHQGRTGGVVHPGLNTGAALFLQRPGGNLLQHHAVVQEAVAGGQIGQLRQDVAGDQNGGLPLLVEPEQQVSELHDALRVQSVDRLVQQQEVRPVHQRQGQPQPLLHAQGEVLEGLLPRARQIHLLQHLVHHPPAWNAPLDAVILQVLPGGQVGIEAGRLHHGPGAGPHFGQLPFPGGAKQGNLPLRRYRLGRHHPNDRGLARAVAAHQPINLPLLDGQLHMVHRQMIAIALGQPAGHQYLICHLASAFLIDLDASIMERP